MHKFFRWPLIYSIFIISFCSTSLSAREMTFYLKEFSNMAHKWIAETGKGLYIVPLDHVSDYLDDKFPIQLTSIRVMDNRILPGKSLVKLARHIIFHSTGDAKITETTKFFASLTLGRPHTYVVTKNQLIFAESTANPVEERVKDKISKHYVISHMASKVQCAGEFFVYRNANDDIHVVFDNASGTYRPNSEVMLKLKNLLDDNLADQGIYIHVKTFEQKVDVEKMFAHHEGFLYL